MHINISFYFQWRTHLSVPWFLELATRPTWFSETDIIWDRTSKKGSSLIAVIINGLTHHTIGSNWRTGGISIFSCCTSCIQYNSVIPSYPSKLCWTLIIHVCSYCICTCIYIFNIFSQFIYRIYHDIICDTGMYNLIIHGAIWRYPRKSLMHI